MKRLPKTGIEYGDYGWNFASGCGNNVEGKCRGGGFNCWAYLITQRFAGRYPNGFKPTIYPEALLSPLYLKKPSRILCAFMGDLFWECPEFDPNRVINRRDLFPDGTIRAEAVGIGIPPFDKLADVVKAVIRACPQHTFLCLTKQAQNLPTWSPFPDNCYVGITVTKPEFLIPALDAFDSIQCSTRYLSIEPMLAAFDVPDLSLLLAGSVDWVILGSQTKPTVYPKIEWVREIVEACDKAGTKVFLKENLKPLIAANLYDCKWAIGYDGNLRQELPT